MSSNAIAEQPLDQSPPGDVNLPTGEASPESAPVDPAVELATIKERYAASSREGQRLAKVEAELTSRLNRLEDEKRSLTVRQNQAPQQAGFPNEAQYVAWHVDNADMTEKQARANYLSSKYFNDVQQGLQQQISALMNMQRFEAEQQQRIALIDPGAAKEASEFFKDIPEMNALPVAEKVERLNLIKEKTRIKVDGRDMTAIKSAAGGSVGSGAGRAAPLIDSDLEGRAKAIGLKSAEQMKDLSGCSNHEQYAAYKAKWKIK